MPGIEPRFNSITKRFSSRDSLGIESVAASISGELCPIVNTVTPRAFYWPFMCWIYYDFYKNSGIKERSVNAFDKPFLKRQDYFFVLANLLADNPDKNNLVGKQKTEKDMLDNPSGPYPYNAEYFITRYGGMQYYNAGCLTMSLITDHNDETGESFSFPKMTQYGEKMAREFEAVIQDTVYYRKYRLRNIPVPKDVLLEYASIITLDMKNFPQCKELLKQYLFERNSRLTACAQYALIIHSITKTHAISLPAARHILYDYFSPLGDNHSFPEELNDTIRGWEIVIGRHYFCAGIEMIWKYMLNSLDHPMDLISWSRTVVRAAKPILESYDTVDSLLKRCFFSYEEREKMVSSARHEKRREATVTEGIQLALSVYNRFKGRSDLGRDEAFLDYGMGRIPGTGGISINEWISLVDRFRKESIKSFLLFVIKECIIEQHIRTCFEKITRSSQSIDGFYFEYVDGLYVKNEHEFQIDFQGIRFIQLMQVMNDLDMFGEE